MTTTDRIGIQNYPDATSQSLTSDFSLGTANVTYVDVNILRENTYTIYLDSTFEYTANYTHEILGDRAYFTTVNYAGISLYSQILNQQDYM